MGNRAAGCLALYVLRFLCAVPLTSSYGGPFHKAARYKPRDAATPPRRARSKFPHWRTSALTTTAARFCLQ